MDEACINCKHYEPYEVIQCKVLHSRHPEDKSLEIDSYKTLRCQGYERKVKDDGDKK